MQQFIPLEDDWSLIEAFLGQRLVPYQPGMPCAHQAADGEAARRPRLPGMEKKSSVPSSQVFVSAL
jgi:hypothetical protein